MLKKLPRLLFLFAVALTVPIQGVAAVSAGFCMALGHHGAPESHDYAVDGHPHDDGAAPEHHHHEGTSGDKSSQDSHCPPCVSCCAAAAIAPFQPVTTPEQSACWVVTALCARFSGVPPDKLDRPPLAS